MDDLLAGLDHLLIETATNLIHDLAGLPADVSVEAVVWKHIDAARDAVAENLAPGEPHAPTSRAHQHVEVSRYLQPHHASDAE
jgi:hypothetical protein